MKLNESDLIYLKDTFGEDNVFDFSGINEFTNDYRNYYEISHYRPHVARKILEIVYEISSTEAQRTIIRLPNN